MSDAPAIIPIDPPPILKELAAHLDGQIKECAALPDGSGFATMSLPLPKSHWIYHSIEDFDTPPMGLRDLWRQGEAFGRDFPHAVHPGHRFDALKQIIRAAGQYAVRAATMKGREMDFDPDALIQNLVVGLLGYHTPDGLSSDDWANPPHLRRPNPAPPRQDTPPADPPKATEPAPDRRFVIPRFELTVNHEGLEERELLASSADLRARLLRSFWYPDITPLTDAQRLEEAERWLRVVEADFMYTERGEDYAIAIRQITNLAEMMSHVHGAGQEHAIEDVNAGRIDDLIAARLRAERQTMAQAYAGRLRTLVSMRAAYDLSVQAATALESIRFDLENQK